MSSYSIDSESPRWWWRSATAGVFGVAAIAAVLVLPASGSDLDDGAPSQDPPTSRTDLWLVTTDPAMGRQCFALPARWSPSSVHDRPLCGHGPSDRPAGTDVRRPGLDSRP